MYGFGFTQSEVDIMKEGFNLFLRSSLNNGGGFNSITFHRNPNLGKTITVKLVNFHSSINTCGNAEFATYQKIGNDNGVKPGNLININLNYLRGLNNKMKLNKQQLIFLIAHEFGHTLGLRHTNWKLYNEPEITGNVGAYSVLGTVPFLGAPPLDPDPNSIFNSTTCGIPFTEFSAYDKIAIKYITNDAPTIIY
ncbi:M57 family metalloprotease [Sphingobacterium faecium]|uniref:M57 family metalloprotease n=1 Tax=Sphingobacterium faecium TaxID=34087 RepID=UPI0024794550|nr:M57 family metalloprotease [Sphingobacterium faecium]WGQ15701.1 M57 family metalloprotease [Sphingobacterium faecium]